MNTRNILIEILGIEWPINAKRLHFIIKSKYNKTISYHTMYEILQDLVEKQIVNKIKKAYLLNNKWIEGKLLTFERIRKSYDNKKPMKIIDKSTSQIKLYSISELYQFILKSIKNNFFSSKSEKFYMNCQHLWGSFYTEEDKIILKTAFKKGAFIICKKETKLSKEISKFYKKMGAKVVIGSETKGPDTIIIDNSVIHIYFPEQIINEVDGLFKGAINLKKMRKFKQIFEKTIEIDVVIIRNNNIANKVKLEIIKHF